MIMGTNGIAAKVEGLASPIIMNLLENRRRFNSIAVGAAGRTAMFESSFIMQDCKNWPLKMLRA